MSNTVGIKKLKNINFKKLKINRAGFFIYVLYNGEIYIMTGVDSKTHDLTDFAGTVKYHLDRNPINGAIRELQEETLHIFEEIKYRDIKDCMAVYDNFNLIIFMPLQLNSDINPESICSEFNEKYQQEIENKKPDPEICCITWLSLDDFKFHIKNDGVFYSKVQNILMKAGNFTHLL